MPQESQSMTRTPSPSRRGYWALLAVAVSLVAALTYHVVCGEHGYLALRRERQQFDTLRKQATQLQQENDNLQRQITALKNDPKTIERRAREDSLMAKPGEIIIRYSDAKASGTSRSSEGAPPGSPMEPPADPSK